MDIKAFQYFEKVCRRGSIPRAAEELDISAQGLSASMRRLSEELGVPILTLREGRSIPTDYGKVLLRYSTEIVNSLAGMRREIDALVAHNQNVVRLASMTGALGYLGEGIVEGFGEEVAGSQAVVSFEGPGAQAEEQVLNGLCDFAIAAKPNSPRLRWIPLVDDCYFLWVNKRNGLSQMPRVSLADLDDQTIAIYDLEPKMTDSMVNDIHRVSNGIHITFVGELIRVFELACMGQAVGLTCRNHVEAIRNSDVVGVPFDFGEQRVKYSLCWLAERELSDVDRAFIDYMSGFKTVCP